MKFFIITVPTGKTHLPVSAGPFGTLIGDMHSAKAAAPASGMQFLTWILPPAGSTNARDFAALSDQSGLLTSYGMAFDANLVGVVASMQPVRLSLQMGSVVPDGGTQFCAVVGVDAGRPRASRARAAARRIAAAPARSAAGSAAAAARAGPAAIALAARAGSTSARCARAAGRRVASTARGAGERERREREQRERQPDLGHSH